MKAPIVLFVYNRPELTKKALKALTDNFLANESDLLIYSDGPKNQQAEEKVQEVRSIIKNLQGFKSVTIIERDKNLGLASSIIDGVTNVVNQYGKIIVLEDDLITSPYFLTYMNDALEFYENDERIACIHGYVYPIKKKLPDYFFLLGADCWGWATWKRGWDIFNQDAQFLLNEIKKRKLVKLFNYNSSCNYFTDMLQMQIDGKVSSWAIRWYASTFLANKYTLYPGTSFVENIGFNGDGTHCGKTNAYDVKLVSDYKQALLTDVHDSREARKSFASFFNIRRKNILYRIVGYIKRKMKTFFSKTL